ncbi:MAG TPA: CPBP family intramembrane glutamic endopeptidase [Gemmatimonadales bacterium]|nr:CPBP family intramembrane glutamic endopeptidase [Gemmatimonadales bacterium]
MNDQQPVSRSALATYLGLTFSLSAIFWYLVIAGKGQGQPLILYLMWCPGLSAIITRLLFQRNVRGQGWTPGQPRWLLLGYFLPVAYATIAYAVVWLTGQGGVDLARFTTPVFTFVVLGSLQSTLSATGEELGWRGFLVPALAQRFSFTKTAILSGLTWSVWHYPLIILANYNAGTATWWALLCFTTMVVGISFAFAWLRLRSGSVWPAALMHASHNLYIQGFLDRITVSTGRTPWLTTEFGAALAVAGAITALLFWRRRSAVSSEQ